MSRSRGRIVALARHEYRSAVRSRVLLGLLAVLIVATVASAYIATAGYRSQLAEYQAYRDAARASGLQRIAPSPLALLSLLRGAVEYIEIIGAVIAITLGYLSVSRERANRTLPLIRSRPVTPGELALGNMVGALALITTLVVVTGAVAVLCLGLIANDWVDGGQTVRLLLAGLASVVYMAGFYCLGALITARSGVVANGLLLALGIWLVVVLILPQIGDTLDADNQVPGGLFSALGLTKPQEDRVLSHFTSYERIRNGIEGASIAKRYERFAFAMTDVKERHRGFTLSQLLQEKRTDIVWISVAATALAIAAARAVRRQPTIPLGGQS